MKLSGLGREQAIFALDDDMEGMMSAWQQDKDDRGSTGLSRSDLQQNKALSNSHARLITKIRQNADLSRRDLDEIMDANEIHFEDASNISGRHRQAVALVNEIRGVGRPSTSVQNRVLGNILGGRR
jgi:hypothetical protein